jgi:hypothetical protein
METGWPVASRTRCQIGPSGRTCLRVHGEFLFPIAKWLIWPVLLLVLGIRHGRGALNLFVFVYSPGDGLLYWEGQDSNFIYLTSSLLSKFSILFGETLGVGA